MIAPVVEGDGEIAAVPVLLRRILAHHSVFDLAIATPIKRPRNQIGKPGQIEYWSRRAATRTPGCLAVLILMDADDECLGQTSSLGPDLRLRAVKEVPELPVFVVIADREYESWLLAGIEGLRGQREISANANSPQEIERIRDAKGQLSLVMPKGRPYRPAADQAALSERFDMGWAHQRSRSFRKLWKDVADLVTQLGSTPALPPDPGAGRSE